jgi:hypothetical protein
MAKHKDPAAAKTIILAIDENNRPRVLLDRMDEMARLSFMTTDGVTRAVLELSNDGSPLLSLMDSDGRGLINLGFFGNGDYGLVINSHDPSKRIRCIITPDGSPVISTE